MTSQTEERPGPDVAAHLTSAAAKTVGRRRGEPLTIAETFDKTLTLAAVFTASAVVAAVLWLRAARRR